MSTITFDKYFDPLASRVMDIIVDQIPLTALKVYSIVIFSHGKT